VLIDWFKDNKMQANPDKFQVLAVGEKTFAKNPSNQIQNNKSRNENIIVRAAG
jgi:hypothetical protein